MVKLSSEMKELVADVKDAFGVEKKKKSPLAAVADLLDNLNKQSGPVQMGIGSGAGLVTGYVFTKGSKAVATVIGLSAIAFTFAEHRGYVKLNRGQFEKDFKNVTARIERELYGKSSATEISKGDISSFITEHAYLLGGFAAGCLIGFGLA